MKKSKKKIRKIIVILIILLVLIGIFFIINLMHNSNNENDDNDLSEITDEISNYIVFEVAEYESIDDVVFYNTTKEDVVETYEDNLELIANEFESKYPNKSILFLNYLGYQSFYEGEIYRCMQIENDQKLDNTSMNVIIKDDGSIEIEFLAGCGWETESDTNDIKITAEEAEQITINYLVENSDSYNTLKNGVSSSNSNGYCTVEFYLYDSKNCWKMEFSTGGSYIMIDANSGEILDEYFSTGLIID